MAKFRLSNGTEVDVPDDAIDRAYLSRHPNPNPTPPAAGATGGVLDPNVAALRETVVMMADQLKGERTERLTERAAGILDPLIKAGKLKPARREKLIALYLADRASFDTAIEVVQEATPLRVRRGRAAGDAGAGDDDGDAGEFGSGQSGDEGDYALGDEAGDEPPARTGASARWDREIARIAKDETKGDQREAARVLQLREPNLYHQRREEFAGHRLPRVVPRNNRHMGIA